MKVTLCGSIKFLKEMEGLEPELVGLGHEVKRPEAELIETMEYPKDIFSLPTDSVVWQAKGDANKKHFPKMEWADVILICNYDKNGIVGYIGGNVLIEIGLAFYLKKPIYLLNRVPDVSYAVEILGMQPIVLNGDLSKMKLNK